MKNGMFNSSYVLLYRQPSIHGLLAEGLFCVVGISKAQEIPGGAHEGVHGVSLTLGGTTTARAGHVYPIGLMAQG